MVLSQEEYVNRIAQQTVATKEALERSLFQRRNQVTDINGIYFHAQGGGSIPAETRIGVSKDMVYLQRFEFKLIISSFIGTGGLDPDIRPVPVTASDFRVVIDDVDVSAYLAAQHNGWIRGAGIWPSEDIGATYDLLRVACDLWGEGNKEAYKRLTSPGYKRFDVTASDLFSAAFQLWCKFPNSNR